jgi:hypothetical protein
VGQRREECEINLERVYQLTAHIVVSLLIETKQVHVLLTHVRLGEKVRFFVLGMIDVPALYMVLPGDLVTLRALEVVIDSSLRLAGAEQ